MDSIVVTITDMGKNFTYDLEIPLNVKFEVVSNEIIRIVSMIDPNAGIDNETRFINERNNQELDKNITVEENCIWNGDYLLCV